MEAVACPKISQKNKTVTGVKVNNYPNISNVAPRKITSENIITSQALLPEFIYYFEDDNTHKTSIYQIAYEEENACVHF